MVKTQQVQETGFLVVGDEDDGEHHAPKDKPRSGRGEMTPGMPGRSGMRCAGNCSRAVLPRKCSPVHLSCTKRARIVPCPWNRNPRFAIAVFPAAGPVAAGSEAVSPVVIVVVVAAVAAVPPPAGLPAGVRRKVRVASC